MSSAIPKPPVSLDGGCSVIDDNQNLYVYTPQALLTLPLKKDGKWKTLSMGKSVTGGVCAGGPKDAFFVIGGTTANGTSDDYTGLQRYSFADDKWETIQYTTRDFQQRTHHGAVYMKGENAFLVFAGVTNGVAAPSASTFTLTATSPYVVNSFSANGAIPATDPTLLPWDDHAAALIGTAVDERAIWTFDDGKWKSANTSLKDPLPPRNQSQPAMVLNDDGSKVLEIFNMNKSPNTVDRIVLVDSNGKPAAPGTRLKKKDDTYDDDDEITSNNNNNSNNNNIKHGGRDSQRRKRTPHQHAERASSLSDIPDYNSQYASDATRDSFSLAQSPDDLVAISGGSKSAPVAVFDQAENGWVDPEQLFLGQTASPTSSMGAAAAASSGGTDKGTIIGAVLGSVLGFAAIIALVVFCLIRRHRKQDQAADQASDQSRLSIQDQGLKSDSENNPQRSNSFGRSMNSVDIFAGKVGGARQLDAQDNAPPGSKADLAEHEKSPFRDSVNQEVDGNDKAAEKSGAFISGDYSRRDTGDNWNEYFQGDEKDNLTHSNLSLEESFSTADQSNLSRDGDENIEYVPPQLRQGPASTSQVMEKPTTVEQAKPMTPRVQTRDADEDSFEAVAYDDEPSALSSRHSWGPMDSGCGDNNSNNNNIINNKKTYSGYSRTSNYSSSVYNATTGGNGRHSMQPLSGNTSRPLTEISQYTLWASDSIMETGESHSSEAGRTSSVYRNSFRPKTLSNGGQNGIDMAGLTAEQRKSMQKDLTWLDLGQPQAARLNV